MQIIPITWFASIVVGRLIVVWLQVGGLNIFSYIWGAPQLQLSPRAHGKLSTGGLWGPPHAPAGDGTGAMERSLLNTVYGSRCQKHHRPRLIHGQQVLTAPNECTLYPTVKFTWMGAKPHYLSLLVKFFMLICPFWDVLQAAHPSGEHSTVILIYWEILPSAHVLNTSNA